VAQRGVVDARGRRLSIFETMPGERDWPPKGMGMPLVVNLLLS